MTNVMWTRLSKWTLLLCVVEKKLKKVCTMSILRPSRHMFSSCAFLCVPSNTKQASETTENQMMITSAWWLLCCIQVSLASTAPVWGLTDASVQNSTYKPGWKGTWLRGDGAGGRAVSTKPKPPYLRDPVSHKSRPPILSVTPAGSVSRLVEEYIPRLRVFGDVRCQTKKFLHRLGVYFLWGGGRERENVFNLFW